MTHASHWFCAVAMTVAATVSCGGTQPAAPDAPPADAPVADAPPMDAPAEDAPATDTPEKATPTSWADMTAEQKGEHMQTVVMPKMGEVFKGYDAERYAKITCVTCHGAGAKKGEFKMPSPDLPKLPPNGQFEKLMKDKPEVMAFMSKKVVPEMAGTLPGVEPYNPETHEGLGCYTCHQSK